MNAKHFIQSSIAAVAIATVGTGAAAAAEPAWTARADVQAAVLQARTHGELVPAGEAIAPFASRWAAASERSRADVRRDVLQARAEGELVPAGQGMRFSAPNEPTLLARAEVKEAVRIARARGELTPAGEGIGPVDGAERLHASRSTYVAMTRR
jgi:hypothetical protein